MTGQLPGLYRGTVANNIDPLGLGRVQIKVPSVYGEHPLTWAMPCVPYAGAGVGFHFIPPNDAHIWVMFEGGDPDHPVWMGCFWDRSSDVPASPQVPQTKVLKTDTATITLNDGLGPPSITIETGQMSITLDATKIEITNSVASVELSGPKTAINGTALEVT